MTVNRNIFSTRVTVGPNEFAVVSRDGRFVDVLVRGSETFANIPRAVDVAEYTLIEGGAENTFLEALIREAPELAAKAFTRVEASADEVALVRRNGKLVELVRPATAKVFNTVMGDVTVERLSTETVALPRDLAREIARVHRTAVSVFEVAHGQAGLLLVDGALADTLAPGAHAFLNVARTVMVKIVDLREMGMEVSGQEVLTKDRVSIRVNLVATYRVADPVRAVTEVKDFAETLYREIGTAFRKVLTSRTLDEVLARKGEVDTEAEARVASAMADVGIVVTDVVLKDVILPGEMRDILNTVVAAEKEAEANVIRRREETSATRALLNTAKVMADNPVMLRLKELEALETIATRVDRLTVTNGTRGLLEDIASLKD